MWLHSTVSLVVSIFFLAVVCRQLIELVDRLSAGCLYRLSACLDSFFGIVDGFSGFIDVCPIPKLSGCLNSMSSYEEEVVETA